MVTLGVDLGTCYSSVGFRDADGLHYVKDDAAASLSYSIPSSVLVRDDGSLVFGARAEQEKNRRPERYQTQFKRDLGSGVPYQLGELTIAADELTARFLTFLVDEARRTTAAQATTAVITVPAAYDTTRREVVERAAHVAGLTSVTMVEEPVAAIRAAEYPPRARSSSTTWAGAPSTPPWCGSAAAGTRCSGPAGSPTSVAPTSTC
jgi:molecular chaperone DnaK